MDLKERKEKLLTLYWTVSLTLMSVTTLVSAVSNLLGLQLPDVFLRVLGAVQILSLISMGVSALQKFRAAAKKAAGTAAKGVQNET